MMSGVYKVKVGPIPHGATLTIWNGYYWVPLGVQVP